MSLIKLEISGGEKPIEITEKITNAKVFLDTVDNNVRAKSSGMLAKIELEGEIDERHPEQYLELFKWSTQLRGETVYRKVSVTLTDSKAKIYRRYEFSEMFVVDYIENYPGSEDGSGQTGNFTLKLTQKDDEWDGVKSFPN